MHKQTNSTISNLGPMCTHVPHFSEIEQSAAELWRFHHWQFGPLCHLAYDARWISTIVWYLRTFFVSEMTYYVSSGTLKLTN